MQINNPYLNKLLPDSKQIIRKIKPGKEQSLLIIKINFANLLSLGSIE